MGIRRFRDLLEVLPHRGDPRRVLLDGTTTIAVDAAVMYFDACELSLSESPRCPAEEHLARVHKIILYTCREFEAAGPAPVLIWDADTSESGPSLADIPGALEPDALQQLISALESDGVRTIRAHGEVCRVAAIANLTGLADAVLSANSDCIIMGASVVAKNYHIEKNNGRFFLIDALSADSIANELRLIELQDPPTVKTLLALPDSLSPKIQARVAQALAEKRTRTKESDGRNIRLLRSLFIYLGCDQHYGLGNLTGYIKELQNATLFQTIAAAPDTDMLRRATKYFTPTPPEIAAATALFASARSTTDRVVVTDY